MLGSAEAGADQVSEVTGEGGGARPIEVHAVSEVAGLEADWSRVCYIFKRHAVLDG